MLYSFDILYFDEPSQRRVPGTIIMDLPQQNIADVHRNPFVIDIVNQAYMMDGIKQMPHHQAKLVDNIQQYGSAITTPTAEIKCVYRDSDLGHKMFWFNIYAIITENTFFPVSELTFNCTDDYEAYEELYYKGQLIASPQIPHTNSAPQIGHYYLLYNLATVDLLKVVNAAIPSPLQMQVITVGGQAGVISINNVGVGQVRPVRLCDELFQLMGFNYIDGNLYGIPQCEFYELNNTQPNGSNCLIQVKKNRIGYDFVIPNANAQYGCKLISIFSLHELQDMVAKHINAKFGLTPAQEQAIALFWNNLYFGAKVIEELPTLLEAYKQNNPNSSLSDKIAYVASYYKIAKPLASHYLIALHES